MKLESKLKKSFKCEYAGDGRDICKYVLQNGINYVNCINLDGGKCRYEIPEVTIGYINKNA